MYSIAQDDRGWHTVPWCVPLRGAMDRLGWRRIGIMVLMFLSRLIANVRASSLGDEEV